jgi:uncharacterized protein YndB with AHSA1/START domain
MTEVRCEADVHCEPERIFDLICDLRGQDRWLGSSAAFKGTHEISANPAVLGTTYREPGPFGVRNGEVTEYERPTAISFHQPMTMKFGAGTIDILMRYTLTLGTGGTTHVARAVTLSIPWPLKLFQPVLLRVFRAESTRSLRALKAHADALGPD